MFRGSRVQVQVQKFRSSEVTFCGKGRMMLRRFLPDGQNHVPSNNYRSFEVSKNLQSDIVNQ